MLDLFNLSPDVVLAVAGYVVLANLLALMVARTPDAVDGEWQAADSRLLFLAAMGGWIGAKLGLSAFHRQGPGGSYAKVLNLSVLVLPVVLAIPVLMQVVPGLISQGYADYSAQYAETPAEANARISPLGAATQGKLGAASSVDAAGTVDSQGVALDKTAAASGSQVVSKVATAAIAPAAAPVLPKRFGPGSDGKKLKTSQKTLSVSK